MKKEEEEKALGADWGGIDVKGKRWAKR